MVSSFFSPAVTSLTALTDRPISIVFTAKLYRLSEQSAASANDACWLQSRVLSRNAISENWREKREREREREREKELSKQDKIEDKSKASEREEQRVTINGSNRLSIKLDLI